MKWYNNLKIKTKLLSGFMLVILLTIGLAILGFMELNVVDKTYTNLLGGASTRGQAITATGRYFARCRRIGASGIIYSGDSATLNSLKSEYTKELNSLNASLQKYYNTLDADFTLDKAAVEARKNIITDLQSKINTDYTNYMNTLFAYAENGEGDKALATISDANTVTSEINNTIDELISIAENAIDTTSDSATVTVRQSQLTLIIISVIAVLFALISAISIANIITKGIVAVATAAQSISEGNFNVTVGSNGRDEIAGLSNNLLHVKEMVEKLVYDIKNLSDEFTAGEIDSRIDESAYKGEFQVVTKGINGTVEGLIEDIMSSIETVTAFGDGNFDVVIKQRPGKKEVITSSFKAVQANLKRFNTDIGGIINGAAEGNLDVSIDTMKYKGDWSKMAGGINGLLEAVVKPIREAIDVLNQLSAGHLDASVSGNYKGEFAAMKSALNNTLSMLSSYIKEISSVLNALAHDDLDQDVTREYVGQFSEMKDALNTIINKFNQVISEIGSAADQVSAGAKQISESSMTLAQGASEQASAVEELNATIITINEGTSQNACNAKEAESLSGSSKNNAVKGNSDMNNMLSAMDGIKESSNSISKIIKAIDDIAFQTNLLALNAAVEAARAGIHGKGFAVVAEEVRSLAGRSQNAAKETAQLIEESINRVNDGTKIAGQTAGALQTIVDDASKIADIISNISIASDEQSVAIGQITEGLSQITEVVQNNSATSEEAASASQQLASQAEMLQNLVSVFKLKRRYQ